ncbi:hypothetical protein SDJN03_09536, partial [Cucurbita argyrosperma subsp. sororia]
MQSSIASARCDSMESETDLDLVKVAAEETFREDFLVDTKRMASLTLALKLCRNPTGKCLVSLFRPKLKIPAPSSPPPCLSMTVGLSFTSGLKLTRLLDFLVISTLQNHRNPSPWLRIICLEKCACSEIFDLLTEN